MPGEARVREDAEEGECGMSKPKFKPNPCVLSGRAARRYNERIEAIEQREAERAAKARAWMAMSPMERRKQMEQQEIFRRIEQNGITIDDLMRAENDAYANGANDGRDATFRKIFAAICLTLHEKHGFDADQCSEVLNDVYDRAVYALNTQDIIQEAFDAVGVSLAFDAEGLNEPASVKES